MSYTFSLKRSKHRSVPTEIKNIIDELIEQPFVILPDVSYNKKLGIYASELRRLGLLHISTDSMLNESIARLRINNYLKPNSVYKKTGKRTEYIFDTLLVPDIKIKILSDVTDVIV